MRKAACFMVTCLLAGSLFLSGCDSTFTVPLDGGVSHNNEIVNFLLYSGSDLPDDAPLDEYLQSPTNFFQANWNLETGAVSVDTSEPLLVANGPEYTSVVAAWDGYENLLIGNGTILSEQSDKIATSNVNYQTNAKLVYGDGYYLEIAVDGTVAYTSEHNDSTVSFPSIMRSFDLGGVELSLGDLSIMASHLDGDRLLVFFRLIHPNNPDDTRIAYVTLNLDDSSVSWSEPIQVPGEYAEGVVYSTSDSTVFAANRLYFSGWHTGTFLDLSNGNIDGLEVITDRLDSLLPGTHRDFFAGREQPTMPVGNTWNTAIFYIQYDSDDSDVGYTVYYAIQGDELVGVLCYSVEDEKSILTAFDSKLNELGSYIFSVPVRSIPLKWQSSNFAIF